VLREAKRQCGMNGRASIVDAGGEHRIGATAEPSKETTSMTTDSHFGNDKSMKKIKST
jgi:hypothetical protein